jgi:hypothetical protein
MRQGMITQCPPLAQFLLYPAVDHNNHTATQKYNESLQQ